MRHSKRILIVVMLMLLVSITACAPDAPQETQESEETDQTPMSVNLMLGFRPDVQFAPFYVGLEEGYFEEAGFDVTISHASESDIVLATVSNTDENTLSVGVVGGEQTLLARSQGIPVVYVYGWYDAYPIAIASKEASNITTPEDLSGRSVGIPMLEGASYLGLTAILNAGDLTEDNIDLQATGFAQVETLATDQVDAVVVYTANEPTQLRERGEAVNIIAASDYTDLLSNGLVFSEETLAMYPEQIEAFVAAFDQALSFTLENPDQAFEHSKTHVEGLDDPDVEDIARQVLENSLALWQGEGKLGETEAAEWQATLDVLLQVGLLEETIDIDAAYSNDYLP